MRNITGFLRILSLLLILFGVSTVSAAREWTEIEIIQSGSWASDEESDTVSFPGANPVVIDQRYDYQFFGSGRFALNTYKAVRNEKEGGYYLYHNIGVYGTCVIKDRKIEFLIEPEKTICSFQDSFVESEYENFIQTFISDFVLDFNVIESVDNNKMILKNPSTGETRSLSHLLPVETL